MTVEQAMQLALQHHQAGRLAEAEGLYRQILAVEQDHAGAWQHLGIVASQTGRDDLAIDWLGRAIAIEPANAASHCDLGAVLRVIGQRDEAMASYRRAIELQADFALPHYSLGMILAESGYLVEAVAEYQKAVAISPAFAEAHNNLGVALKELGRPDEAIYHFRAAIQWKPENPEAHNNLGMLWTAKGQLNEARTAFGRALTSRPDYAEAHNNLGIALQLSGRLDEAVASFERALRSHPSYAEAYNNLGNLLANEGRLDEALAAIHSALALKPDYAEAYGNLGGALAEQGRFDEADGALRRALEIDPHCADARVNYSFLLLLRGDYARGWFMYESRGKWLGWARQPDSGPDWDGGELHGERVLLRAEQGLGDAIQFSRYAELVASRGGHVILECDPALAEILRSARGVHRVLPAGDPLPVYDFQLPLLSLPLIFRTDADCIPGNVPYLFVDTVRREVWQRRLPRERAGYRVGLAWAGGPQHRRTRNRNVPLEKLWRLMATEGVDFYSLQIGVGATDLQRISGAAGMTDHTAHIRDFADTAALTMEMDLTITVDTAVAHLAGALGRPVWTLLPFVPDWRWGLEGDTTAWYPTMRLFRQPALADWDAVIQRVAEELKVLAESGHSQF